MEQGWSPPGGSAREAEVLAGVAEHLTNAEIGARLFILRRALAAGQAPAAADYGRVRGHCRGLDGVALAIELAAARLPALGLDGLEAGLADRLELLAGGRRIDDRHRSLRSALDWSFALLDSPAQAVLGRGFGVRRAVRHPGRRSG